MSQHRQNVRSDEERDVLIKQFYRLPQHIVNRLWHVPSVRQLGHDDAIQIGFLHLIRSAELWESDRGVKFKTYAYYSIMRGVLEASKRKPNISFLQLTSPPELVEAEESERVASMKEFYEEGVMDSILLLPPRLRRIILDTCLEEESYEVVGKKFQITKERVRQLRELALGWLKSSLNGEHPKALVDNPNRKEQMCDNLQESDVQTSKRRKIWEHTPDVSFDFIMEKKSRL